MRRHYNHIFVQQPIPMPNLLMDVDFTHGMNFDGEIVENVHSENIFFGPSAFMAGNDGYYSGFYYGDYTVIPNTTEMQTINGNNINGVRIVSTCETQYRGFHNADDGKFGNRGLISVSYNTSDNTFYPTYFTPIKGTMDFSICIGFKTPSTFKDYYYNSSDRCFNLIGQTNVKTWTSSNVIFNANGNVEIFNYNTKQMDATASSNDGRWLLGINYDTTSGEISQQIKFWFNNLNGNSSNYYVNTIVQPNTYYHVTLTRKNNVFRIYVNGNEVGITRTAGGTDYTIGGFTGYNENIANNQELMPLFIGTYNKCGYFCATDFVFTDAKIYDGALTLEQIQTESSPYYVH